MNTATYIYPKPDVARIRIGRVLGMGLVYAEGAPSIYSSYLPDLIDHTSPH